MGFDQEVHSSMMADAIRLHNEGDYQAALDVRQKGFALAPDNSIEQGVWARDQAYTYDRLGEPDEAKYWADKALAIHRRISVQNLYLSHSEEKRQSYLQRGASRAAVATIGMRAYIEAEKTGRLLDSHPIAEMANAAGRDLVAAASNAHNPQNPNPLINSKFSQYDINFARRGSIINSVLGEKKRGRSLGVRAVKLSFMSESPSMDTSSPGLTRKERMQAKKKAFLGGIAALGVNLLITDRKSRRRDIALAAASKIL